MSGEKSKSIVRHSNTEEKKGKSLYRLGGGVTKFSFYTNYFLNFYNEKNMSWVKK